MSGLAALFCRDGRPADPAMICAMLSTVPYRAIDGAAIEVWGHVALGYAYTAVLPEDQPQPVVHRHTCRTLIADVRLDNRADILSWLPDRVPTTISDAELMLHAYEAWGCDAFQRFLGDFAVVIWDPRSERMICARDTSGQRGLYYRYDRATFAAATEIQQLLQDPAIPVVINHDHIRDSLVPLTYYRNVKDQQSTYYKDIWCLPAGHVLCVDADDLRVDPYWEFSPPRELRYRLLDDYADHFHSLLSRVVIDRLRSNRPIGATLSGGLDSSSIVGTAHEAIQSGETDVSTLTTFSIVYPGQECDERPLIELANARYGFEQVFIDHPAATDPLANPVDTFLESPDAALPEVVAIFDAAERKGVRTILTGDIADACVGGDWYIFDSLARRARFAELTRALRAYQRAHGGERFDKVIAKYCLLPLAPLSLQRPVIEAAARREFERDRHRLVPHWMPGSLREDLLQRHLQRHLDEVRTRKFASPARHHEYTLLYPPEAVTAVPGYGIDIVRPFADRRLHEFLLAVPPETKFFPDSTDNGFYAGSKRLLRHAMRDILPDEIREKKQKVVFNSVFEHTIRQHWALYTRIFGPGTDPLVAQYGYIDRPSFWRRLEMMRSGERLRDYAYIRTIVELEGWLRSVADTGVAHARLRSSAAGDLSGHDIPRQVVSAHL